MKNASHNLIAVIFSLFCAVFSSAQNLQTNGTLSTQGTVSVGVSGYPAGWTGPSILTGKATPPLSNVYLANIKFKTQSQHWSFYDAGSAKTGDGYVNKVKNLVMSNCTFSGGLFSWGAGGGTGADCTDVVIQNCSGDHISDLTASGVTFRN